MALPASDPPTVSSMSRNGAAGTARRAVGLAILAVLAIAVWAPAATAAVTPQENVIRFESPEVMRYSVTVRFAGSDAQLLRMMFNTDHDRYVSPAEVQEADRNIASIFPSALPPFVDGRPPVNTTYDPSNIQGATGAVNATGPILVRLHIVHRYEPDPTTQHVLTLRRTPSPSEGLITELTVFAPPAFVITGTEGIPASMVRSPDGTNITGLIAFQGPIRDANITFDLDSKWNSTGIPGPALPVGLVAVLAAVAVWRRRGGRFL